MADGRVYGRSVFKPEQRDVVERSFAPFKTVEEFAMKVFVTGANGFIGSALCKDLLRAGHDVAILVRDASHWRIKPFVDDVLVINASLGETDVMEKSLSEFHPDAFAHLAWAGVGGSDRNDLIQVDNIVWSCRLAALAETVGASTFIGVGSQAEYGPKHAVIGTDETTDPTTLYGESKLATSRLCHKLCDNSGLRFGWARVFSTYGPGDHPRWMIPGLIDRLIKGEVPALTGGEQAWDFLNVADAASALRILLESADANGIFNLGSGHAPTLRTTIEAIRDAVDPDLELGFGDIPYRPDQVMVLQADTSRLTALGWSPSVDLNQGIADTVEWYKANDWIYRDA